MDLVREIMTHPKVWPHISDDGSPDADRFIPLIHHGIIYLLCYDREELLGLWMFVQQGAATIEVHTCLVPGHGFRRARTAARGAAEWIWEHTQVARICTSVPERNRIALKFAQDAGMVEYGRNPSSFLKDGVLQDQILLGISRPEETECQQR